MITYIIIGITVLVSYRCFEDQGLFAKLCHHPYREVTEGQYYRMITGGFVHGSWTHLLINMWVLLQFGGYVESALYAIHGPILGTLLFIFFYLSAIAISDIGTLVLHKNNPGFRSVGASGVTSATVFIYAMFEPWAMFVFPPVPAIVFAVLYVVWSQWASKNQDDNIDHLAHLYGGLYGIVFIIATYPPMVSIFWDQLTSGMPFG